MGWKHIYCSLNIHHNSAEQFLKYIQVWRPGTRYHTMKVGNVPKQAHTNKKIAWYVKKTATCYCLQKWCKTYRKINTVKNNRDSLHTRVFKWTSVKLEYCNKLSSWKCLYRGLCFDCSWTVMVSSREMLPYDNSSNQSGWAKILWQFPHLTDPRDQFLHLLVASLFTTKLPSRIHRPYKGLSKS